jgi:hypothetical protein
MSFYLFILGIIIATIHFYVFTRRRRIQQEKYRHSAQQNLKLVVDVCEKMIKERKALPSCSSDIAQELSLHGIVLTHPVTGLSLQLHSSDDEVFISYQHRAWRIDANVWQKDRTLAVTAWDGSGDYLAGELLYGPREDDVY